MRAFRLSQTLALQHARTELERDVVAYLLEHSTPALSSNERADLRVCLEAAEQAARHTLHVINVVDAPALLN